ncbi:MAG: ABC transporter ATP-binding protein [Spirochaetales bacterium]|nr:ABC transporter ATP-binding protein [Spirochaetales bacterium]
MIEMIKKFLKLSGKKKKNLYIAWFFQLLTSMCEGGIYFTLFYVIKDLLSGDFSRTSVKYFGISFLVYTLVHMLVYFGTVINQRPVAYAIMRDERLNAANTIKGFPLYFFSKDKISQLTSLFTTDLTFAEMNIMEVISGFVSSIIMTIVFSLMLLFIDYRMALLLLLGIIPGVLIYHQSKKRMDKNGIIRKEAQVSMIDTTLEYVQGMETIKAYQMDDVNSIVEKQVDDYAKAADHYETALTNSNTIYKIGLNMGIFISLFGGVFLLKNSLIEPDVYIFFAVMGIIFYRPMESLIDAFAVLNLANQSLDNILLYHQQSGDDSKTKAAKFNEKQADVRFENVSFSYDKNIKAIDHVSFSAKPGSLTALVGPSGSGKSTLLNMIPNFVTPQSGHIYINDIDTKTMDKKDLIRHISIVFQDVYLFHDTLLNNIRMGNSEATETQVIEAAKKARCHEFIQSLPDGYQTVISEGGASLSGGERQRIAIARAILKNAPVILLDEALSSLDSENAVAIQKGIEEMIQGKTVFLVSHTLSYLRNADQILVLEAGHLKGNGQHTALLDSCHLYKNMWEKENATKSWKLTG